MSMCKYKKVGTYGLFNICYKVELLKVNLG